MVQVVLTYAKTAEEQIFPRLEPVTKSLKLYYNSQIYPSEIWRMIFRMGAFAIIIPYGKFTMHVWFIVGLVWHLFSCSFTVWLFAFISSMVIPILYFISSMVNPILSLYMFALFSSFSELISCSFNSFDSGLSFSLRIKRSAGWIVKQKGLFSEDELSALWCWDIG